MTDKTFLAAKDGIPAVAGIPSFAVQSSCFIVKPVVPRPDVPDGTPLIPGGLLPNPGLTCLIFLLYHKEQMKLCVCCSRNPDSGFDIGRGRRDW